MASEADIQTIFARTPANRLIGSRLVSCGDGQACVALPVRPELIQEKGVVHGGFLSTLMDSAAVYAIVPDLAVDAGLTGVEFKVNFMRPGRLDRGEIEARSKLVKRGQTLSIVDVEALQEHRLLAKGLFTYMTQAPPAD
jgi:acyl-CoA thioesterase